MKKGNQYKKGANWERWWTEGLRRKGALSAARSAGSHGIVDVWALFYAYVYVAQLKSGKSGKGVAQARQDMKRLSRVCLALCQAVHIKDARHITVWTYSHGGLISCWGGDTGKWIARKKVCKYVTGLTGEKEDICQKQR